MGEIFRTVAAVKPVEWAEQSEALEQTQGEGLQAGNTPASPAIRRYMVQPLVEMYGGCMVVLKVS